MGYITDTARRLRRRQTRSEQIFWELVRNRKLAGLKFTRQMPFVFHLNGKQRFFVADFYCAEMKLVIELDGPIHEFQVEKDAERTAILQELGVRVLRIRNEELRDMARVRAKIEGATHPLSPSLLNDWGRHIRPKSPQMGILRNRPSSSPSLLANGESEKR